MADLPELILLNCVNQARGRCRLGWKWLVWEVWSELENMNSGMDINVVGQAQLGSFSSDIKDSEWTSPGTVEGMALALGNLVVFIAENDLLVLKELVRASVLVCIVFLALLGLVQEHLHLFNIGLQVVGKVLCSFGRV